MLFQVEPIVFIGVVCRWCAALESEDLSKERPAVADCLGTLGAMEAHGRGTDKQWDFSANKFAVAGCRGTDYNALRAWVYVRH